MKTWLEPEEIDIPEALRLAVGGHPLVAQTLWRRGVHTLPAARAFLDPEAYAPAPPWDLPGMGAAVERLLGAIRGGEAICVWGDFDVDGQTATSLLVSVLRDLGGKVSYHIPVRAVESHGVNLPALREIIQGGAQVLLTCDTGIGALAEAAYAREQGLDVIITDHHDLPRSPEGALRLPEAAALVNPKLLPGEHPLATLPGVGVAYKLAEALCQHAGQPQLCDAHLDLVALGIVADIALLRGDTRYLLQRGLRALRQTPRPGLLAMMETAELNPAWLSEDHIGFELGPRLNALGRLDDANPAVELLTTGDIPRARALALRLEGLNARRKLLTSQVLQGALAQIEADPSLLDLPALVLAHPAWPAGVIGIVAGQLAERYHKPTLLIATPPGEGGRGSARSVEGVDIHAAIAAQRDLLDGFGGHPMAAGLSIQAERIPEFRRRLGRTVRTMLGEAPSEASLLIDSYLSLGELSLELAADLERLAPFGAGNPPLTLACRGLSLASSRALGRNQEHRLMLVQDDAGVTCPVVWWQGADWPLPDGAFDLAYTVRASSYRGGRELQVEWVDARPSAQPVVGLEVERTPIQVQDYRAEAHPLPILERLQADGAQVWCEGEAMSKLKGHDRYSLEPCTLLAIWTAPPGPTELRLALEAAAPQEVALFGIPPQAESLEAFLQRLAGLVKYALKANQGRVSLRALAAATAQREETVRLGLAWLEGRGHIRRLAWHGDEGIFEAGNASPGHDLEEITARLKAVLEEATAYRRYFLRADKDHLSSTSMTHD